MAPWTHRFDEQDVFMGHERGKSNDIHVTRNSWDGVWNLVGCRAVLALTYCLLPAKMASLGAYDMAENKQITISVGTGRIDIHC